MQHEDSFHLDEVRHIQDDEALRTVLDLNKLPQATTLGDWLRRMGSQPQIQDAWVKVNKAVLHANQQTRRDGAAAKRFFKRLLRSHGDEPRKIVTDKLRSYGVVHRELMPDVIHSTEQYENNRAEQSHEATRVRERGMRRFKSFGQAQRFVTAHAAVSNLFNLGRHLVRPQHYRDIRISAFGEWEAAVA